MAELGVGVGRGREEHQLGDAVVVDTGYAVVVLIGSTGGNVVAVVNSTGGCVDVVESATPSFHLTASAEGQNG